MSYWEGKDKVCVWIRNKFSIDSTILDVGACNGFWHYLLPEYENLDGIEAFRPNYENLKDQKLYRNLWCEDIRNFQYDWYDIIIFGDIIEHMTPEEALKVLDYAKPRCTEMIISVPFLYPQEAIYDNPYEKHIQDDLTPELFEERYPGYEVFCRPREDYCYYHKRWE